MFVCVCFFLFACQPSGESIACLCVLCVSARFRIDQHSSSLLARGLKVLRPTRQPSLAGSRAAMPTGRQRTTLSGATSARVAGRSAVSGQQGLAKRKRSADPGAPAESPLLSGSSSMPKKKSRRTTQSPEEPRLAERLLRPSDSSCSGVPLGDKCFTMGSICSGIGTCHKAMALLRRFNPTLHVQHIFACEKDPKCRVHLNKLVENHP